MNSNSPKRLILGSVVLIGIIAFAGFVYLCTEEQTKDASLDDKPAISTNAVVLYEIKIPNSFHAIVLHDNILNSTCWARSFSTSCISDNHLDPGARQKLTEMLNKSKLADDK